MSDIRNKINLIALIAAIGAILALIGCVMAVTAYPQAINWMFAVVFVLAALAAILNILPRSSKDVAGINVLLGIICILDAFFAYSRIIELIEAGYVRFDDLNIGVWIALAGSVLYLVFSISDYYFKRKNQ